MTDPTFLLTLTGKYLALALAALSLGLIWGYAGILSLGHGVFFAMGGYLMGMHLMMAASGQGVYRSHLPDFMIFLDWTELPWYWSLSHSLTLSLILILLVPAVTAGVFGMITFFARVNDVYFAILTQATTYALMLLFYRNELGFGGENGLTDFKTIAGFPITESGTRMFIFLVTVTVLVASFFLCRLVVRSHFGSVLRAIRDNETRLPPLGYKIENYKFCIWVLSAVLCSVAGALYVLHVGIINPGEMRPDKSIEMAVWVAMGGRGTLIGPILGAVSINGFKSWLTVAYPQLWLFVLGLLFVSVSLWLPRGLVGLVTKEKDQSG